MTVPSGMGLHWVVDPEQVDQDMKEQLLTCWRDVSNAGGAVRFPFPPVTDEQVRSAVDAMVASLASAADRLLLATAGDVLAGWLLLRTNPSPLTHHWAQVLRVQTALQFRGRGVGQALMGEVARSALKDLGLEQLHLELRAGLGLEAFYRRFGWEEVGRWPGALRLAEHDSRDEVLMLLSLVPGGRQPAEAPRWSFGFRS